MTFPQFYTYGIQYYLNKYIIIKILGNVLVKAPYHKSSAIKTLFPTTSLQSQLYAILI